MSKKSVQGLKVPIRKILKVGIYLNLLVVKVFTPQYSTLAAFSCFFAMHWGINEQKAWGVKFHSRGQNLR